MTSLRDTNPEMFDRPPVVTHRETCKHEGMRMRYEQSICEPRSVVVCLDCGMAVNKEANNDH